MENGCIELLLQIVIMTDTVVSVHITWTDFVVTIADLNTRKLTTSIVSSGCALRATFQALSEYTPEPSEEDGVTSELVKSLPKCVIVQLDGLIPLKCLHGLGLAVRHPSYHLTRFEIDLLPYHTYQVRFPSKVFNFILMISYKNA